MIYKVTSLKIQNSLPVEFLGKVVLKICSKFTEHFFLKTPLEGCFWKLMVWREVFLILVILKFQNFKFFRSSRLDVFCKKGVLVNFAKLTGIHLCQGLFFNKVAGLRPEACNFIKKKTLTQMYSCEFCEIYKNTFFTEHVQPTASEKLKILKFQNY